MTEASLNQTLQQLTAQVAILSNALVHMARTNGDRLTRAQVCQRRDVCSKTLTAMVRRGDFPTPGTDGRWLLAEVVEWEAREAAGRR